MKTVDYGKNQAVVDIFQYVEALLENRHLRISQWIVGTDGHK